MQMKHEQLIKAFNALERLCQLPFHLRDARNLMLLHQALMGEAEFHNNELEKLIRRYNPTGSAGKNLQFSCPEDRDAFDQAYTELSEMDVLFNQEKIRINIRDYGNNPDLRITPEDLIALDGIVEFIDQEG